MYAASFDGCTVVVKVQPCDDSTHEYKVLRRMKDSECHTVHTVGLYDHTGGVDTSALVLKYVPYEWNEWNEHMSAHNNGVERGFQLCEVCGAMCKAGSAITARLLTLLAMRAVT